MENFKKVKHLVSALEVDADKFYNKGNMAAGIRFRKGMQDLKTLAQLVRVEILETKNEAGETGSRRGGGEANDRGPGRGPRHNKGQAKDGGPRFK